METRELTEGDAEALRHFDCRVYRQPWTEQVQEAIREGLPDRIAKGAVGTLGLWDDAGRLVTLIAWTEQSPEVWTVHLLATATGHMRHKYALRLKREMLELAWAAGCFAVESRLSIGTTMRCSN